MTWESILMGLTIELMAIFGFVCAVYLILLSITIKVLKGGNH